MPSNSLSIITGASSNHFRCLENLLHTIAEFEPDTRTVVYDLGLRPDEARALRERNVTFRRFEFGRYPAHVDIRVNRGEYAWKPIIVADALREFGGLVLWLDAGNLVQARLDRVRAVLIANGVYSPISGGTVQRWTHPETLRCLSASPEILTKRNRNAAIVGFSAGYRGISELVERWKECALTKKCIAPPRSDRSNHRQDQSVLTVLLYQFQQRYGWSLEDDKLDLSTHKDGLSISRVRQILFQDEIAPPNPRPGPKSPCRGVSAPKLSVGATARNTAVLTLGCYPSNEVQQRLAWLHLSAAKFRIPLTVVGVDEAFESHYHSKVLRLRDSIKKLPDHLTHVLYVDGRDSMFCRSLADVCEAFNRVGRILAGAESVCFPCRNSVWSSRFPKQDVGRRWINAGGWMGERSAVNAVLNGMVRLSDRLMGNDPTGLERLWPFRRYGRDDQFLWQACYLYRWHLPGWVNIQLDARFDCFANVTCGDRRVPPNRHFDIEDDQVVTTSSGCKPGVLHFSGSGSKVMDEWAAKLRISAPQHARKSRTQEKSAILAAP